ncbi:MAG: thiamine phosphate synthase [Bryobacteraceae bacterium]|nr:thiamine phosphate synthase [Bryobacteraceae bacterium]
MIRCYITDRHSAGGTANVLRWIARALEQRVDLIQIREKDLSARELFALARQALTLPNPGGAGILVNTRADVALAAGAHGLHLPAGSIAPPAWRRIVPAGWIITMSCHTIPEVRAAAGADFLLFGPVFDPRSKPGQGAGLAALAQAVRATPVPVLALGGITSGNANECMAAGAAGIAAVTLFQTPDP